MTTTLIDGQRTWNGSRDHDGHRTYKIKHLIRADEGDGPSNVMQTPGLPLPGSMWQPDDDLDVFAYFQFDATVSIHQEREGAPSRIWVVEQTASTRPFNRCQDEKVEDPLLEPAKVSGSDSKYQQEGTYDRFGRPILTSSWEAIRGPQNEWDHTRSSVRIEQNVATVEQAVTLPNSMIDTVNQYPLWGMPPRCIKLSGHTWSQLFHGQCSKLYSRVLVFDIRAETFDRDVIDEGSKCLRGKWNRTTGLWDLIDITPGVPPSPLNPLHFDRFQDRNGNMARVILDGAGLPYQPATRDPIFTCEQCPDGAPRTWRVVGPEDTVTLTYVSGCMWQGTIDGNTYTLEADIDNEVWVLSAPSGVGTATTQWQTPTGIWQCFGPNLMVNVDGDEPEVVTLIAGNQPGVNHIEFYAESDLLQLGIPVTL